MIAGLLILFSGFRPAANKLRPITTRTFSKWRSCTPPQKIVLNGLFVKLEPFDVSLHSSDLYNISSGAHAQERMQFLLEEPQQSLQQFVEWMNNAKDLDDPIYYAVRNKETGKVEARCNVKNINTEHGVAEFGGFLKGQSCSRRITCEAVFLIARYLFEDLGFRRVQFTTNNQNEAAKRFLRDSGVSFEGVLRQARLLKGNNQDTAMFSIVDYEWECVKTLLKKKIRIFTVQMREA